MGNRARTVCALAALCTAPVTAVAVDWPAPSPRAPAAADDPIAPIRWGREPAWHAAAPDSPLVRSVMARVEQFAARNGPGSPRALAARAVALRYAARADESREALDRAVASDRAVLDDPDVALTRAYLLARAGQYAPAVAQLRAALARLDRARADAVIEAAGWSMARGPDGLPDAIALLREAAAVEPGHAMLLATLSLALFRAGRLDEARAVAATPPQPRPFDGAVVRRGALLQGEGDAATGTSLLLAGHGRDAVEPLARAAASVPAPWRASGAAALAEARGSRP